MTDFDYGLANHAIRITSDRSDCVCLWFWPQMTGITDRMIAAAKQDIWEARREPRGQVFCGERRGKQCDLSLDQLRAWKGLVRVRFEYKETAAAILSWAKENGIVLVDDREKLPVASPVYPKAARHRQDREGSTALRREAAVPPLTHGASATSGSSFATSTTEARDRQHLVTQNGIAAAPTEESVILLS